MQPMSRISDAIEHVRKSQRERSNETLSTDLRDRARTAPEPRSLGEALSEDMLGLIVEPKRATAAKGMINAELDIAAVARDSQHGCATALSIVTDAHISQGSIDDIVAARGACELPILARDFIVHVNQVYELRAAGADAIVVPVVAFVDDDRHDDEESLEAIVEAAFQLGMEVVLSVQSDDELERALETDVDILNIDNRNRDERIDVERTFELLADVPVGTAVISESVANADEVSRLHRAGVDALLLDEGHIDGNLSEVLAVYRDIALHDRG